MLMNHKKIDKRKLHFFVGIYSNHQRKSKKWSHLQKPICVKLQLNEKTSGGAQ
ncbi:hypothetical protein HanRHA438_Chr09g0391531 [Helianthus annuus]|nr:hypothetical protein HanRHA438_Chr09g0391531 [Helianthus annuus]